LGLDISGSGKSLSELVLTKSDDKNVEVMLLGSLPKYNSNKKQPQSLAEYAETQINFIQNKVNEAQKIWPLIDPHKLPMAVDTPIDVSELTPYMINDKKQYRLLHNDKVNHELMYRAIDRYYNKLGVGVLAPFGDRIGHVVMRFHNIYMHSEWNLGDDLFETYPAASLYEIAKNYPDEFPDRKYLQYKGTKATWRKGKWVERNIKGKKTGLKDALKHLKITSCSKVTLTDNHLDSIICSLAILHEPSCILQASQLDPQVRMPDGYQLLQKDFWDSILIVN
jgi:hypothetical protein